MSGSRKLDEDRIADLERQLSEHREFTEREVAAERAQCMAIVARRNATIVELRAALAPFAALERTLVWPTKDHYTIIRLDDAAVTVGDVRRAAALLADGGAP